MAISSTGLETRQEKPCRHETPYTLDDARWLRAVFENSPDAIVIEDLHGNVLDVNLQASRLYGRSHQEMVSLNVVDLVPPDVRSAVRARFSKWVSGELTCFEGACLTQDGRHVPVEFKANRIMYKGQDALLFVVRDLSKGTTEHGQSIQAQKMEALAKLAGGIAHDFNNLFMVIMNSATFVREDLPEGGPAHDDLDNLLEAAREAVSLTGQLLCFSRKQMCSMKPVDFVCLFAQWQGVLERTVGEQIQLSTEYSSLPLWVKADAGQLEQALLNLVDNARDAMPHGGQVDIRVRQVDLEYEDLRDFVEPPEKQTGEYMKVEVTDTGKGVNSEVFGRIFDPFFTTKPRGRGTGLGLSTTYGIVRQHAGYMAVSPPGRGGATFTMYLPCEAAAVSDAKAASGIGSVHKGHETILLAEDNLPVRTATRRMLEQLGYRVLEAADGFEALEVAAGEEGSIDLLFTDVVMPGMDGATLAEKICHQYPRTKVVFASGYPEDHLQAQGVIPDNIALLQKPFNGEQMAHAVRSVLDAGGA